MASRSDTALAKQWQKEFELTPPEQRPLLLQLAHSIRQGLAEGANLPGAAESFRQGWRDVKAGRVYPIESLWDGIDAQ
jgi:hypothetical protein